MPASQVGALFDQYLAEHQTTAWNPAGADETLGGLLNSLGMNANYINSSPANSIGPSMIGL